VALLDSAFVRRVARWPEVIAALFERSVQRSRTLAFQMAVSQLRRVDTRLLLLFWRLADRWGRVTPEGVIVPMPLTHSWLARLVGAQRPSVTTALKQLTDQNALERLGDGGWLLKGDPPPDLAAGNGDRDGRLPGSKR
jgi:CRP-like cAMP-binding protein